MSDRVELKTTPAKITEAGDAWVLHFPRFGEEGTHFHSYGLLTPYFKGLAEGRLMGTRCVHPACPISRTCRPAAWCRAASTWTLETRGQVASR